MADLSERKGEKLAPFNPSGEEVINVAVEMLELREEDIIYELGCGDARFLVEAVSRSGAARAVGVEYDKQWAHRARERVRDAGLQGRIAILHEDVMAVPIGEATALFVYLVPRGMSLLRDRLVEALRRGARVVSYVFAIPGLESVRTEMYKKSTKIMLYTKES
ncbi:unnamed protein product, partial [Phaeothamnion confervicola]